MKRIKKVQTLGYIETGEEEAAREFIEKQLGFPAPRASGFHLIVKIITRPEEIVTVKDDITGKEKSIYLPAMVTSRDKYTSCSALVIAMGPHAYTGRRFEEHWFVRLLRVFFNPWMRPCRKFPWCKVGDFICIPRNEGTQVNYRGVPVQYIPDDKILGPLEDPSFVTRD